MKDNLKKLIGDLPSENGFIRKMRFHQAWWRAFVLAEPPGDYPGKKNEKIGNTILNGKLSHKNFFQKISAQRLTKQLWKERRVIPAYSKKIDCSITFCPASRFVLIFLVS